MPMQTFNSDKIRSTFDHYFIAGDFKQIVVDGQLLLESALTENQIEKMKLGYLMLIKAYYYLGEFEHAYEYVLHYQQLIEKLNIVQEDFNYHYIKAHMYEYEKDSKKVQQTVEQCMAIATNRENYSELCRIKTFYSNFLLTNGQLELALNEAQATKQIIHTRSVENLQLDFRCQLLIASILDRLHKHTQSFSDLYTHPVTLHNPFERCRLFYTQAMNNIYSENWDLALHNLAIAEAIAIQNNAVLMQLRIVQQSILIYEKLSRYQEAFDAMKRLGQLKDVFYKTSLSSRLTELSMKYNVEQIRERANIDPLSGVYNRNYLEENAGPILEQALIHGNHICCMVFDVDNFKAINDTYGHLVGDEVIKILGQICSNVLKDPETIVARYGGDEFVILTKSYGEQDVLNKSQHLFDAIAQTPIFYEDTTFHISISIGIVCNRIVPTTQFSKLFESADHALYSAKRQGKNQIVYMADL